MKCVGNATFVRRFYEFVFGCSRKKSILLFYKYFFSHSADRAYPIFRNIFKSCSWCDSVVRIAELRIIYISAWFTYIFLHIHFPPIAYLYRNISIQIHYNTIPSVHVKNFTFFSLKG